PSPHVVVIGAGFGGLLATRTLARYPVRVTLIDRKNFHTFQPLLYQVATAGLSPGEIAAPIRWILSGYRNVQVLMGEVQDLEIARHVLKNEFHSIDPQRTRIVLLEGGPRILPAYPEDLSRSAEAQLRHLGVEVQTSAMVTGMQPAAVLIGKTRLPAAVVLWAAGVAASPLGTKL